MAGTLRLEVREFQDLTRWQWVLTDPQGAFIADHEVRLEGAAWQYEAFSDLTGYLSWHAAPDRRAQDEARIIGEAGAWIGSQVLGPGICAALVRRRPATVRVVVPPEAAELLYRPLELAHADGRPLAVQDVTLVMDTAGGSAASGVAGEPLRVLGLFSLPEGGRALNLRRERAGLVRLVRGIAASGRAADVRVLQYGVTRARLRDVLSEYEGWDIIHVSGHGRPGSLTLETASGSPDRVSAPELAGLLEPARGRLRLVTVSACWSAAVVAGTERGLLGIPAQGRQDDPPERDHGAPSPAPPAGALATELTRRLGCAVLAMRYPVSDDFAIALSGKLYDLLARQGQPLPRAVGLALRELSAAASDVAAAGDGQFPALSVGTPAIFGGAAAELRMAAPSRPGPARYDTASLKMAGFPPEPSRLVGRTGVLARASAALATASGVPGLLLHGMPGGGKTACALELAHGHEEAFDRLTWYKAPDEGMAIDGALADFALTLERYLPGFQMADRLVPGEALASFLPRLTELLEARRVLIVIDNMESLLSESGVWRDDRWGSVIGALTAHTGLGRVVLTSRRMPTAGLPAVLVEAVDALSADEALLLARELPNLSSLKLGTVPGIGPAVSKQLARNAIAMAQGHPKLLELAEGQAAHPDRLLELVKTGDQEWRRLGGVPEGFFTSDGQAPGGEDYLQVLAAWTQAVADSLTPGERDLFWFLCCLEGPDRERHVLDGNWAGLWTRLAREGMPPALDAALAIIAVRGLAAIRPAPDRADTFCEIHPGVAQAGRAHAGQAFRDTVDIEAAAYWDALYGHAAGESGGGVITSLQVRAGLAAVPYFLRQQQWTNAAALLEGVINRDPSRATAAAALPSIQQVLRHDHRVAGALARVLEVIDPVSAEVAVRTALADAQAHADYRMAAVLTGRLADLFSSSGRLSEALHLTGQRAGYTRRAGLGPWTQLSADAQRLQVLVAMGQSRRVLAEARRLGRRMNALPATAAPGAGEAIPPWNVREAILDAGSVAASRLGRWAETLDLNAVILTSMRGRGAPAAEIARIRFNDYFPLLRLGRTDEALSLLLDCRQMFQDAGDTGWLGRTLSALADTEDQRGHGDTALRLERDALRYTYLAGDVPAIAASYRNLGNYLHLHARQPAAALASHLATALIGTLAGIGGDGPGSPHAAIRAATADLRKFGTAAVPPRDIAGLCDQLSGIPGTDLARLIVTLTPDPETAERVLRDLTAKATRPAQPQRRSRFRGGDGTT